MESTIENHARKILTNHPDLCWDEAVTLAKHFYGLAKLVCADFRQGSSNHLSLENPGQHETITSQETMK